MEKIDTAQGQTNPTMEDRLSYQKGRNSKESNKNGVFTKNVEVSSSTSQSLNGDISPQNLLLSNDNQTNKDRVENNINSQYNIIESNQIDNLHRYVNPNNPTFKIVETGDHIIINENSEGPNIMGEKRHTDVLKFGSIGKIIDVEAAGNTEFNDEVSSVHQKLNIQQNAQTRNRPVDIKKKNDSVTINKSTHNPMISRNSFSKMTQGNIVTAYSSLKKMNGPIIGLDTSINNYAERELETPINESFHVVDISKAQSDLPKEFTTDIHAQDHMKAALSGSKKNSTSTLLQLSKDRYTLEDIQHNQNKIASKKLDDKIPNRPWDFASHPFSSTKESSSHSIDYQEKIDENNLEAPKLPKPTAQVSLKYEGESTKGGLEEPNDSIFPKPTAALSMKDHDNLEKPLDLPQVNVQKFKSKQTAVHDIAKPGSYAKDSSEENINSSEKNPSQTLISAEDHQPTIGLTLVNNYSSIKTKNGEKAILRLDSTRQAHYLNPYGDSTKSSNYVEHMTGPISGDISSKCFVYLLFQVI